MLAKQLRLPLFALRLVFLFALRLVFLRAFASATADTPATLLLLLLLLLMLLLLLLLRPRD